MSDIVERLRVRADDKFIRDAPLMREAADEIERLRAALQPLASAADDFQWVTDKGVDEEGCFLWAQNGGKAPKRISVGDAFRAKAALAAKDKP